MKNTKRSGTKKLKSLNPGSDEAVKAGCLCPVMDNGHGKGAWGRDGTFWINGDCPLHAIKNRS